MLVIDLTLVRGALVKYNNKIVSKEIWCKWKTIYDQNDWNISENDGMITSKMISWSSANFVLSSKIVPHLSSIYTIHVDRQHFEVYYKVWGTVHD